jgi:hypothetical protein
VSGPERAEAVRESFARRKRFEAAHPDVTIVLPARPTDRWRAVVPLGCAPEGSGGTLGGEDLEELMDQLEEIYRRSERDGGPVRPRQA